MRESSGSGEFAGAGPPHGFQRGSPLKAQSQGPSRFPVWGLTSPIYSDILFVPKHTPEAEINKTMTASPPSLSSSSIPSDFPSSLHPLLAREGSSIPLIPQGAFSRELSTEVSSLARSEGWSDALRAALHLLNDETGKAHDVVTDREDCAACNVVHAVL